MEARFRLSQWSKTLGAHSSYVDGWPPIEAAISTVFPLGGNVELAKVEPVGGESRAHFQVTDIDTGETWSPLQEICMEGEPGRCRILVSDIGGHQVRIWTSGGPPRGQEVFVYDDVTDLRSICEDVAIVKDLFREFFNNGLSPRLIDTTL